MYENSENIYFFRRFLDEERTTTLCNELTKQCQTNPQMIFVGVSRNSADIYKAIKKVCCIQNAVPSQVVTQRVMGGDQRRLRSVATKVAIQVCIIYFYHFI